MVALAVEHGFGTSGVTQHYRRAGAIDEYSMGVRSLDPTAFERMANSLRAREDVVEFEITRGATSRLSRQSCAALAGFRPSPTQRWMLRFLDGGESWCEKARSSSGLVSRSSGGLGLSLNASATLLWFDAVAAVVAFAIGGLVDDSVETNPANALGPALLGLGLAVLWIVGLASGAPAWATWPNFAFAVACIALAVMALGAHGRLEVTSRA